MQYIYSAKNSSGGDVSGTEEAKDKGQLSRILKDKGFFLIKAEEKGAPKEKFALNIPFLNKVSLTEKLFFTRNLQFMISSGLSLPRAMSILIEQVKSPEFKKALADIEGQISKGNNFSDSLKKWPDIFPELFQSMIRAGEESGSLEESLKTLTIQMEKDYKLKAKVQGALVYPAVIVCAMLGIGILMLIMVVPTLASTFKDLGVDLPVTTKAIIWVSSFIVKQWLVSLIIVFVVIFSLRFISKTTQGKKFFDSVFLKVPVISSIVIKTNSAYTVRTLSSLIDSGIPILKAMGITSSVLDNVNFKLAMERAMEKVKKGEKISDSLASSEGVYPLVITQMIKVGEETGETSKILSKLAEFFEEEVDNITKNMAAIIEPVLMVVIGIAVGFFAISMIQPMYSMLGSM
ncbi:MAG: hypothetical protein COZ91_02510 [Candidatus Nealsonbacteria bacterium CG_4_8_14_3_um_filter_39_7]|uniref:Type II secretion system protein GspF domain-containing protein n=1 Tax=Candidatus Nealsonbacteria bacterium CG23_combo_of_CG06-09_8_20_14_all_39_17 TaxID=1974722 RepID=A0A2G9YUV2_9BACT|nr:MAG: hypothetical protein COX37_00910 [Candidatus Nealsonbacteria bacterium CG23_combo_of_CG06-09_8_20_14_all_39_17]PIU44041.1 MAG: hypothetical protein COS96_01165 [Candidatus Nealsonbacteria bacterium CG07_land_8_20_14_0_80_39_13]PIW91057.1 MAG: hypothetical protein COZ91_02510 [Candidatus Nealsonbacteria bacterium CG_4_8_14_3_um_filter_39_7]